MINRNWPNLESQPMENYKLVTKSRFQRAKYRVVFNKLIYIINECTQFLDEPYARYIKEKTVEIKNEIAPLFQRHTHTSDDGDYRLAHHHLKSRFYDHAPIGFVILNPAAGVIDYNNKIKEFWGLGEGSLRGVSFFSLLDARYGIKFNQILREVRISREERNFECFCRRLDGRSFFARFHISMADVATNENGIILVSVLDVTKELTTERIIRSIAKQASTEKESEYIGHLGRLLASIEETELVVIALRDETNKKKFYVHYIEGGRRCGTISLIYQKWRVHKEAQHLMGTGLSKWIRDKLLHAISPDRFNLLTYGLNSYIFSENDDENLGHVTLFFKQKPKEAEHYQDLLNLFAHRITQEAMKYQYWKQEQQIKVELERMVAQRTRDLNDKALRLETEIEARNAIEAKLIQAKQRAELSNRAKSQFLANMSHEIRTPLNGILGITSILKKTTSRRKRDEYIKIINQSGKVLLRIIDDILDLTRLEAGQLQVIKVEFDFRQTLLDIYYSHFSEAKKKNLKFFVSFPFNQPCMIKGDEVRIRQVIDNLVSNAIKFTDSGFVLILIKIKTLKSEKRASLHVSVIDSGPGLTMEQRSVIWRRFERLDHSTTRKTDGFGLGLAITDRLLKLMNGRIILESQVGKGSQFDLTLPIEISPQVPMLPIQPPMKVAFYSFDSLLKPLIFPVLKSLVHDAVLIHNIEETIKDNYDVLVTDSATISHFCAKQFRMIRQRVKQGQLHFFSICDDPTKQHQIPAFARSIDSALFLKGLEKELCINLTASKPKESPCSDKIQLGGKRILLAEDNEVNQRVSADMLRIMEMQVEIAANGCEALVKMNSNKFDLILMDCFMPEMDGVEAMKLIKTNFPDAPPIIAVTANAIKGEREKYLEEGFDGYLSKPFNFIDLKNLVFEYLDSAEKV